MAERPFYLFFCWRPALWVHAFMKSLAAVVSLTAVTGVVFLPGEYERLTHDQDVYIRQCEPHGRSGEYLSLVRLTRPNSFDGEQWRLVVHDLQNQTASVSYVLPMSGASCFATSSDGNRVFVGDFDGGIRVWDTQHRTDLFANFGRHVHGYPSTLLCSPDDRMLLSLDDSALYGWDLKTSRLRWCRLNSGMECFSIHPNSQSAVCGRRVRGGAEIVEIDLKTGKDLNIITTGSAWRELRFSPDGRYLVAVTYDGVIQLLQKSSSCGQWAEMTMPAMPEVLSCVPAQFSLQSDQLIVGHPDGRRLMVWDLESRELSMVLGSSDDAIIGSHCMSHDTLLTWGLDGAFRVWNLATQTETCRGQLPELGL